MLTVNLQRLTSATLSITSAFAGFCVFPKHKCIYLHMCPSARAPDLSPDKTHCGLQQMDTDTHTRTKKNNEIPPELSHTATTLGELEKNSSLSFSVVPHSVSNLSHLSDNLSLSHYSLIFPPQLAAGCDAYVCVSVCVSCRDCSIR